MKHSKLALVALVFSALTAEASVTCSNAAASLTYAAWHYEGGAAPPYGMVVGRTTWTLKGKVISVEEYKNGQGGTAGEVDAKFDASTKHVIVSNSTRFHLDETYSQKVTVARKDGGAIDPDTQVKQLTDYLICRRVENYMLP